MTAVATIVAGLLLHRSLGRSFNPMLLLVFAFSSLAAINVLLFCVNLFKASAAARRVKSESEQEQILAPAFRGDPSHLGVHALELFRLSAAVSIGFIVGAAILVALKHYRIGF
jgi:hypothetical protein